MQDPAAFALWKWRYQDYTSQDLSEVARSDPPGEESDAALAAIEILAERATQQRANMV